MFLFANFCYNKKMKNLAILLAGGTGSRISSKIPKQLLKLKGKTILEHTVEKFEKNPLINAVFIVIHPGYYQKTVKLIENNHYKKVRKILKGGETRMESSAVGVFAAEDIYENVLIHDAARPFILNKTINAVINQLKYNSAVNLAVSSTDTMIEVSQAGVLKSILDRHKIKRVQTPQGFKLQTIKKAHHMAQKQKKLYFTDDCSLIYAFKLADIKVLPGDESNIKITTAKDLITGELLIEQNKEKESE